ncbi:cystatin [Alligator mississippiensis]|nr:cystatin [Alligator mississippiensis]
MATGAQGPRLALAGLGLLLAAAGVGAARAVPMPGAPMAVPVTDPGVQAAARAAVGAFNRDSDDPALFRVRRVLAAQSQVVSGVKYHVTVELERTRCRKGAGRDPQACAPAPPAQRQKLMCEFQVWSRPWLHDTRVLAQSCVPAQA